MAPEDSAGIFDQKAAPVKRKSGAEGQMSMSLPPLKLPKKSKVVSKPDINTEDITEDKAVVKALEDITEVKAVEDNIDMSLL